MPSAPRRRNMKLFLLLLLLKPKLSSPVDASCSSLSTKKTTAASHVQPPLALAKRLPMRLGSVASGKGASSDSKVKPPNATANVAYSAARCRCCSYTLPTLAPPPPPPPSLPPKGSGKSAASAEEDEEGVGARRQTESQRPEATRRLARQAPRGGQRTERRQASRHTRAVPRWAAAAATTRGCA